MKVWKGEQRGIVSEYACTGAMVHFFLHQEETSEEAEDRSQHPKSFQQKRDFFQKMGERGRCPVFPILVACRGALVGLLGSIGDREGHVGHLQDSSRSR